MLRIEQRTAICKNNYHQKLCDVARFDRFSLPYQSKSSTFKKAKGTALTVGKLANKGGGLPSAQGLGTDAVSQTEGESSPAIQVPIPGTPPPYKIDLIDETQRYVLADEWGFDLLGNSLPAGLNPLVVTRAFPDEVMEHDTWTALKGLILPAALMAIGYFWLWYMHSIIPLWQQVACWLIIGTGYTGLFTIAHECARGCFLLGSQKVQDTLGSLIMAPALFSLHTWRARVYHHFFEVNTLGTDFTAWHPVTVEDVACASPVQRTALRLATTTPLKLLSSIGEWARSLQDWDVKMFYELERPTMVWSWCFPAAFVGLALPCILALGGPSGFLNCWLAPWLVFHCWLSLLTMLQHTAPHIPFRRAHHEGQDPATAIVSGTVTVHFPSWLERVLNYANYHMPQHLSPNHLPYYHAKAATEALRANLWPYMTETKMSLKLLINHITKWQVYDEEEETYITFDKAEELAEQMRQQSELQPTNV